VVGLDQLSKAWAQAALPDGQILPLVPGLLQLQRVSNTGAAFSLLRDSTLLLGIISAVVAAGVALWLLWRPPARTWLASGAGFLLGGALGNGLDRWRLGAVIDFLEFVPISFPIFNLADVAINLAVACFVIDTLLSSRGTAEGTWDSRHD
jgi:signal peptidase II